jgi:hypothetical protein
MGPSLRIQHRGRDPDSDPDSDETGMGNVESRLQFVLPTPRSLTYNISSLECPLEVTDGSGPDTGIVNFYQMKDTLMGHVDRAEYVHSC